MKIFESIGTPGTALPRDAHVAIAARWGAGTFSAIDLSTRAARRFRDYAGFPAVAEAQACESMDRIAMNDRSVLDGPAAKPVGVPLPRCRRCPDS